MITKHVFIKTFTKLHKHYATIISHINCIYCKCFDVDLGENLLQNIRTFINGIFHYIQCIGFYNEKGFKLLSLFQKDYELQYILLYQNNIYKNKSSQELRKKLRSFYI